MNINANNARSRLGKIFWIFTEKFGLVALSIFSFFLYAKLLTPEELGLAVLVLSIVELFSFLYSSTIDNSYISLKNLGPKDDGAVFWATGLLSLLTAILIMLGFISYFDNQQTYLLCAVAVLFLPLQAVTRVHIVHLRKKGAFKSLAQRTIVGKVAGMTVGIFIAFYGGGAWAIIVQAVIMSAVSSALLFITEKRPLPFVYNKELIKTILKLGVPASVKALSWNFVGKGIVIIVEITLGTAAVGFYNFANRLIELPRQAIYGALMGYAYPVFSNRNNSGKDINSLYLSCTKFSLIAVMPLFMGLSAVADLLVVILFGDKWLSSIPLLEGLAIVTAFSFFLMYFSSILVALGKTAKALKTEIFAGVIALVVIYFLADTEGLYAAVYGLSARLMVILPLNTMALLQVTNLKFKQFFNAVYKPVLASVTMYLAIIIFKQYSPYEPMLNLIVSLTLGCIIYSAFYLLIDRDIVKQAKAFINQ